jgi:NADPH:quinone reductase-like Zn-dependent oxidoreductase
MVLAKPNKEDLTVMYELMKAEKVTPVIDKRYRLSEVPEAIRYLEEGHARGKVIINGNSGFVVGAGESEAGPFPS